MRVAVTGYHDSGACHCVLFDAAGAVTRPRAIQRVREKFAKAVGAFHAGQREQAAFYAGAVAHYVGELSQFCHVMGAQSHWRAEDQVLHAAYENAVDRPVAYQTRSSSLLDAYLQPVSVPGNTPEAIAEAVARFTETGDGTTTASRLDVRPADGAGDGARHRRLDADISQSDRP